MENLVTKIGNLLAANGFNIIVSVIIGLLSSLLTKILVKRATIIFLVFIGFFMLIVGLFLSIGLNPSVSLTVQYNGTLIEPGKPCYVKAGEKIIAIAYPKNAIIEYHAGLDTDPGTRTEENTYEFTVTRDYKQFYLFFNAINKNANGFEIGTGYNRYIVNLIDSDNPQ